MLLRAAAHLARRPPTAAAAGRCALVAAAAALWEGGAGAPSLAPGPSASWPTPLTRPFSAAAPDRAPPPATADVPPPPPPTTTTTTTTTTPPRSVTIVGQGQAASPAELASVLGHSSLLVTRDVELATIVLGFEQANRYAVRDESGGVVALLFEETAGVGAAMGRQLLRRRRAFTATLTTPDGRLLLRVRRPLYLINSLTLIEDAAGAVMGEVRQEWAPLRRKYNLFLRDDDGGGDGEEGEGGGSMHFTQALAVDAPFLAWEFPLLGPDGHARAILDRNFQGFGKELFTDAGRYALHFGEADRASAAARAAATIAAAHPGAADAAKASAEKAAAAATLPPGGALVPVSTGDLRVLPDPLSGLDERALALALAVAVDFDYFSQHSAGGGGVGGMWPLFLPIPSPNVPAPPPVVEGADGAGGAAGAEAAGGGAAPSGGDSEAPPSGAAASEEPLERDLGSDPWSGGSGGGEGDGWGTDGGGGGDGGGDDAGWGWEDDGDGGGGDEGGGGAVGGLWDLARGLLGHDD